MGWKDKLKKKMVQPVKTSGLGVKVKTFTVESWQMTTKRAVVEAEQRREAQKQDFYPGVFIKDGDSVNLRFLDEEPAFSFYQHGIGSGPTFHAYTCTREDDCPLCGAGIRRSMKAAYRVFVEEIKDKKGKVYKNECRIFVANQSTFEALQVIAVDHGLSNRWTTIRRKGTGFDTLYVAIPAAPSPLSSELKRTKVITPEETVEYFRPRPKDELLKMLGNTAEPTE